MKPNWAAKLYLSLACNRLLLITALLLGLGWSFLAVSGLELDKSLKALMPDSSASLRQTVDLLDMAPFSRIMLIQLTAEDAAASPQLAPAADKLVSGLKPDLAYQLETAQMPDLHKIMALMPALCDEDCLARLNQALSRQNMDETLAALKLTLSGSGGLENFFWRVDPLNLRMEIFGKFPRNQGWPLADPLLGYPLTPDGRHLLIIIKPLVSMNDTRGAVALMDNISSLTEKLPGGISAQVIGAQRHTAANAASIERDLTLTLSLAMLLILAIYFFLVRSLGAVWLFLTPAVAVVAAAAGLAVSFPKVSGLALGFGAAVLGIAEDYAVHTHYALRRAACKEDALTHVARPLLMSAILCVVGFGVLMFSSIPAIRQLAFFSALAITVGYIWAIVVLPHCPAVDRPRETALAAFRAAPLKLQPGRVWPVFVALAGLSLLLMNLMPLKSSIRDLGLADPGIMRDQLSIENNWKLESGRRIYLVQGANQAQALELAGELTEALNKQAPGSASSLASLLPPPEKQQANLARWRTFMAGEGREMRGNLTTAGQAAGFTPDAFAPFFDWLSAEAKMITSDELISAGLGPLVENFILPTPEGHIMGVVMAYSNAPDPPPAFEDGVFQLSAAEIERSLSQSLAGEKRLLPYCVAICLGVLIWAFRDVSRAVLAFIPALCGLAAVLLFQLILNHPLGLVEAAALPLVICLGADYGIVVVSELTGKADLGAPKAIFVSGLSTIAGIGILILASHPVLHALGKTVFIGLAAAMPASILLLPQMYSTETGKI